MITQRHRDHREKQSLRVLCGFVRDIGLRPSPESVIVRKYDKGLKQAFPKLFKYVFIFRKVLKSGPVHVIQSEIRERVRKVLSQRNCGIFFRSAKMGRL